MDGDDVRLLRALLNSRESERKLEVMDLAESTGLSVREARQRLEALEDAHLVALSDSVGARTATLLLAGVEVLRTHQVVVNGGFVQVGHRNVQVIGSEGAEPDDDDDEADEEDDDGEDLDDDDLDDEEDLDDDEDNVE